MVATLPTQNEALYGTASMTQGRLVVAVLTALILLSFSSRAFAARQENDQLTQFLGQARDESPNAMASIAFAPSFPAYCPPT